jgi:hypothetical protein
MFVGSDNNTSYEHVSGGTSNMMADESKVRGDRTSNSKTAFWNNQIWHLKIQTSLAIFNFILVFALLMVASTVGLRVSSQVSKDLNVYWRAMNLTPDSVELTMNQTRDIIEHTRNVAANMVPISKVTVNAMVDDSAGAEDVTFAQAATSMLVGLSMADWRSVMGNTSLALGSVSHINYTAVTGVFRQAQDPSIQGVIKNMTDHALGSFDYAANGLTNMLTLFKDGVINEDKKAKTDQHSAPSKPSELATVESEAEAIGVDLAAASNAMN